MWSSPIASFELRDGAEVPLSESDRARVHEIEQHMAGQGLRVLAVARKRRARPEDAERRMTLLGLVGIMDPPRAEAKAAVRTCEEAGITPVMITGDHPLTARSVAAELGLLKGRVVSGQDLESMTDADLDRDVADISVYARVSPADKLRVVSAWQRRGEVVAMTGDGVNDAPALKKADVGIAMGITGTDVSKEASGMTLLDDNFASIVAAVEEGRIVFGNIKKYLTYLLSSNVGEIVLMAGAALGRPAAAAHRRPDPLREPRDGWLAGAGARGGSAGARPDAAQTARSPCRRLHPPAGGAAAQRRPVVGAREHHALRLAPSIRASRGTRDGDDVRVAWC